MAGLPPLPGRVLPRLGPRPPHGFFTTELPPSASSSTNHDLDASAGGLGIRSKRYCMVVDDGVVKSLSIEDSPGKADASGADALLKSL